MIVILHQGPPVATVPRAAAVGEVLRTKRRWTVLQEILSVLTSRGCFLKHLVDGSIRTSEDLLLHHFVEAGFFDFQTYQDVSGGYAQAIKENAPSNDAQFYWASVYAVRVPFRDLHYVTISVWWKLTLIVEIDGAHS